MWLASPAISLQDKMRIVMLLLIVLMALLAGLAHAQEEYARDPFDAKIARDSWNLIGLTEQRHGVPPGLLHAMSLVETGQGIRGWMLPWPYTVGVNSPGQQSYLKMDYALNDLARYRKLGFVRFEASVGGQRLDNATLVQATALFGSHPNASTFTLKPKPFGRRFSNSQAATSFVYEMFARGHNNLDLGLMQINWKVHGKKFRSVADVFNPSANVNYAVNYLLEHRQTRDWWGSVGRYHSGTAVYAKRYIKNVWTWYRRVHQYNGSYNA